MRPGPIDDTPLPITTAKDVDESLFLLRALDALYDRWPIDINEPAQLQQALGSLRHEAERHRQHALQRGLDERIASGYGDLVGLIDAFVDALDRAGRIEREGVARAERERAEGAFRSGISGGMTAAQFQDRGASGGETLLAGAGATLLGVLLDEMDKGPARDEAKRQALVVNARAFEARWSAAYARLQATAPALEGQRGWARGEAGFDLSREQAAQFLAQTEAGDISGLIRVVEVARRKRPRDPYPRAGAATLKALSLGADAKPDTLHGLAEECLAAAAMVPEGSFYDAHRADFVALAGCLANMAAAAELPQRSWARGPATRGPWAVRVWRTYLAVEPLDSTGEAREQLALALAGSGRLEEARAAATEVAKLRGGDAQFAYNYACFLSLTRSPADALSWLDHAIRRCGFSEIAHARNDPDLQALRSAHPEALLGLTELRFDWLVDWGTFSDDIVLTNKSPFALTNVTLDATVTSPGSAPWTKRVTAERIEAGATLRWNTWVRARGRDAHATAVLRSDQN